MPPKIPPTPLSLLAYLKALAWHRCADDEPGEGEDVTVAPALWCFFQKSSILQAAFELWLFVKTADTLCACCMLESWLSPYALQRRKCSLALQVWVDAGGRWQGN